MHVTRGLHVAQDIFLKLGHGREWVGHVLVLLDVADDFGRFGTLGEVDECGFLDDGGDSIFDEGEICEVDA